MYDNILVATDGSEGASRAVEHAIDLAGRCGAHLNVLAVVDSRQCGEPALSTAELAVEELEDRGHRLVDGVAERAADADVATTTRVCHGVPDEEIRSHAADVDADLVVLGIRGGSHERHLGSVCERVVCAGEVPVLSA